METLQTIIREIKARLPIVEGIESFGGAEISQNGHGDWIGWHKAHGSESKTSLHVDARQDTWYCFNCGQGGDVIEWVGYLRHGEAWRNRSSATFVDVLREMASNAGMEWPEFSEEAVQAATERHQFWDILMAAADYYHTQLPDERRQFLRDRYGLTDETVNSLKLGWATPEADGLIRHLRAQSLSTDEILSTGLVLKQKDGRLQDHFRGRLVFPYWKSGKAVYFIARMTDATPEWEQSKPGRKYVKQMTDLKKYPHLSPHSQNIHFYYEDAARNTNTILLTEGVTDCILANQCGFPCLSPMTVRFRKADRERLAQLVKHAPTIYIANDNEENEAGAEGAMDTARYLWEQGKDPLLVTLPRPDDRNKIDLNDFLREHGATAFEAVLSEAKSLLDLAIDAIGAMESAQRDDAIERELVSLIARHYGRVPWERYKVIIKERLGITNTALVGWVKEYLKIAQAEQGGHGAIIEKKDQSWPYAVREGRLVYLTETLDPMGNLVARARPVGDFEAQIASEITDEGGERTFVVKGKAVRGGPFQFELDAEEFGNDRKLKAVIDAASGARDPVRAGMGKHLSPALKLLTSDKVEQLKRYRRTGWENGQFLIPGREPEGVLVELPRKPPFRVDSDADLVLGLEALEALLESMTAERSTVAAALVFQAPLSKIAGWDNERYSVFISGRTGSLKTTFAQTLMCVYGPRFADDEMLVKWGEGATTNAMMSMATSAHDLPFLIDNFKPSTGGGARAFVGLVHNILEGGEKDRLTRAAHLRDTRSVFCWPLCTGEDVPDSDPASLARILVVPFVWQSGEDNLRLSEAQKKSAHLPAVGEAWLAWLETSKAQSIAKNITAKFEEYRSIWSARLRKIRPDNANPLRVASNLSSNQLTWEVLCKHPSIGEIAQKFKAQHLDGLENIIAIAMAEATAEALEASRYLAAIKELLLTEQALIMEAGEVNIGPQERMIGYSDSGGIYLLPRIARRAVESLLNDGLNGISQAMLHKQLNERGFIASHNRGTLLKTKKIKDKAVRVLHLTAEALEERGEIEEAVAPPKLNLIPF